mmetsp:Transcript_19656/g.57379  ORF Transcript_19656/g.57379 Transcript_19656/m.57379 type:complete len:407 (+) Transcript_19656:428-1648(+)
MWFPTQWTSQARWARHWVRLCSSPTPARSRPSRSREQPSLGQKLSCLVGVVLDEGGGGGGSADDTTGVDALLGIGVGLGALGELCLGSRHVLWLAEPGLQAGLLEGAAVGEGEGPGLDGVELVHGVEGDGGILLGHAAGEEGDAGHGHGDHMLEHAHGGHGDLHGGSRSRASLASPDHVGLEEGALEEQVVVGHGLVDRGEDLLRAGSSVLDGVFPVHEHLGLNDGHEAVGLANGAVPGEGGRVLVDGELGRRGAAAVLDVQHSTPLGESSALGVVLGAALAKVGDALGHGLAVGAEERLHAHVHLDARDDTLGLEQVHHRSAVRGRVEEGLLVGDHTRDVLLEALSPEEELAVGPAVVLVVLHRDLGKALANGARGLVGGKDALALGRDGPGGLNQFSSELHGHD